MKLLPLECGMAAVVAGYTARAIGDQRTVTLQFQPAAAQLRHFGVTGHLTPDEARSLAALLTAAADKADGVPA